MVSFDHNHAPVLQGVTSTGKVVPIRVDDSGVLQTSSDGYVKPETGIPKTDLESTVQTSLGKSDTAYQKPDAGIPKADLDEDVQTSLNKADTAIQNIPDNLLKNTDIVDNLTSTSTTSVLSANQGSVLKTLIDSKTNTPVIDNLNSTSTTSALSANQGKILKGTLDGHLNDTNAHANLFAGKLNVTAQASDSAMLGGQLPSAYATALPDIRIPTSSLGWKYMGTLSANFSGIVNTFSESLSTIQTILVKIFVATTQNNNATKQIGGVGFVLGQGEFYYNLNSDNTIDIWARRNSGSYVYQTVLQADMIYTGTITNVPPIDEGGNVLAAPANPIKINILGVLAT
jgi:hypothetical protein